MDFQELNVDLEMVVLLEKVANSIYLEGCTYVKVKEKKVNDVHENVMLYFSERSSKGHRFRKKNLGSSCNLGDGCNDIGTSCGVGTTCSVGGGC